MAKKYGKCTNIGGCDIADKKREIEILDGQDFICPECRNELYLVTPTGGGSSLTLKKILTFAVPILLVLAGVIWWVTQNGEDNDGGEGNDGGDTTIVVRDTIDPKPIYQCFNESEFADVKFSSQFSYSSPLPSSENNVLKGVVEMGATGFDYSVIRVDADKNWELIKYKPGWSLVFERMATEDDIRLNLKNYIGEILNMGVRPINIHFVVSSGAHESEQVKQIEQVLQRHWGYIVNTVTPAQEAGYALKAALPKRYMNNAFVVDIGSSNTKIAWSENNAITGEATYGSKYSQIKILDELVCKDVREKSKKIPKSSRETCFIIGGIPYEFAKIKRQGKERYTTLENPIFYRPEGDKQQCGLNIYSAIAAESGCKEFIFDWDAHFSIGFLLSLN